MAEGKAPRLRELFIEELMQVQGGEPLDALKPELGICQHWYSTMACGEEGPPCPSGC